MDGSHDHGIIRHTGIQNGNRVSVLQIIKIATLLTATHRRPPPQKKTTTTAFFFCVNPTLFKIHQTACYWLIFILLFFQARQPDVVRHEMLTSFTH